MEHTELSQNVALNSKGTGKRVVVTGAAGYIGRHVIEALLQFDCLKVIACDIRKGDESRVEWVTDDLFYSERIDHFFERYGVPDVCIHLAWKDGFRHNSISHLESLAAHYTFLTKLVDAGCKSVSVMGTMHEVGYHEGAVRSDTPCSPMSLYGIAKNALRQAMLAYCEGRDISLKWLRAYYITGDDMRSGSIFSHIERLAREGKKSFPFTDGLNQYDFIDIDELAYQICVASLQSKIGGIINVCSGCPVSLKDRVVDYIREKGFDIRPEYGAFPSRRYDSPVIYGDNSDIKKILAECDRNTLIHDNKI